MPLHGGLDGNQLQRCASESSPFEPSTNNVVCETNKACKVFKPRTPPDEGRGGQSPDDGGDEQDDMVCYKGGIAVEHNYQMCDVTSKLQKNHLDSPRLTSRSENHRYDPR